MGFFDKLKKGLEKTRKGITGKIDQILVSFGKIDDELFEELEEALISSDVGVDTTLRVIGDVRKKVKERKLTNPWDVKELLKEELAKLLSTGDSQLRLKTTPSVIIVVGVNGVGKQLP